MHTLHNFISVPHLISIIRATQHVVQYFIINCETHGLKRFYRDSVFTPI